MTNGSRMRTSLTIWLLAGALLASGPAWTQDAHDLRLRDFAPRSMLRAPSHEVLRARFPAIDVHNHVNDAHGDDPPVAVPELVATMDRAIFRPWSSSPAPGASGSKVSWIGWSSPTPAASWSSPRSTGRGSTRRASRKRWCSRSETRSLVGRGGSRSRRSWGS